MLEGKAGLQDVETLLYYCSSCQRLIKPLRHAKAFEIQAHEAHGQRGPETDAWVVGSGRAWSPWCDLNRFCPRPEETTATVIMRIMGGGPTVNLRRARASSLGLAIWGANEIAAALNR